MYVRDADRVVIAGDVLANVHFITGEVGLREPPPYFSHDFARNRDSVRLLASLQPSIACFGHGPPLHDCTAIEKLLKRWDGSSARTLDAGSGERP
jgi:hypothetical protein